MASLSRRDCLRLFLFGPLALGLPAPGLAARHSTNHAQGFLALSEGLLADWCRGMLVHQVYAPADPVRHGGLMSPAEQRILGRCADAVYPFLWYARRFQDERYIDAAVNVMSWALNNVALPDGSWKNGVNQKWQGISVFTAISVAQALRYHSQLLAPDVEHVWRERLHKTGQWLKTTITPEYGNINYPISNALAMALLGDVLDEPEFSQHSRYLAHAMLEWITPDDGLVFGEGRSKKVYNGGRSPKGCYPIDLGYNVEESLPGLAQYALLSKDPVVLDAVVRGLKTHMQFLLPDGGWDNSWGTRNFKWTWWGSRTADGCQPAYALLADHDPGFLEIAYRNTRQLRACTHEGLLTGGPHYVVHGVATSIHHTFCHAKALATVLDAGLPVIAETETSLPCETSYGWRHYADIDTWLIAEAGWRATLTAYDFPYKKLKTGHASGGALSLLWHQDAGLLVAASMNRYTQIERYDMQPETGSGFGTLTPRVELVQPANKYLAWLYRLLERDHEGDASYTNIMDYRADITVAKVPKGVQVKTGAQLLDARQRGPEDGPIFLMINYRFSQDLLKIQITPNDSIEDRPLKYIFPLISKNTEPVERLGANSLRVKKSGVAIEISANQPLHVETRANRRIFSHVPGLEALPLSVNFTGPVTLMLKVLRG